MSRLGRDYAYQKVRARILKDASVCHICGHRLDFSALPRSRWAPTVDHLIPVSSLRGLDPRTAQRLATDPSTMRAAHYGCNSRLGARKRTKPKHVSRSW